MKISEAITELEKILKEDGDLEIVGLREAQDHFLIEHGMIFSYIKTPCEHDESVEHEYCAFLSQTLIETDNTPPILRLVP